MVLLPSIALLIARHGVYDKTPLASYNDTAAAGFKCLTDNCTACSSISSSQSAVLNNTLTLTHMTATAIPPAPTTLRGQIPYLNATSAGSLTYGSSVSDTLPSSATSSSVKTVLDALWSLHWPSSNLANSSIATVTATATASNSSVPPLATLLMPTIPLLTTRLAQPSAHSSRSTAIAPITTMSAVTLSSMQNALVDPSMFDPIIFDPGRLSSSFAQTSTIHITVTASVPGVTPTTSAATVTNKATSTLTTTVKPFPSFVQSASPPSSVSPLPAPQSNPIPSSSSAQQSDGPVVRTSVISKGPGCPYPLPGVYCGEPKTTLITETTRGEASPSAPISTGAEDEPKEPGWCPYPGMKC